MSSAPSSAVGAIIVSSFFGASSGFLPQAAMVSAALHARIVRDRDAERENMANPFLFAMLTRMGSPTLRGILRGVSAARLIGLRRPLGAAPGHGGLATFHARIVRG